MSKYVYFFGSGKAEGKGSMKDLLGGKGANLAEMTNIELPVPPGFTITTEVCKLYYKNNKKHPTGLEKQVEDNIKKLEKATGKKFGDPSNPMFVSVRSGAKFSMPGMMDTILNIGLNDQSVEGLVNKTKNERMGFDSYRRIVNMLGDVVMGIPHEKFEHVMSELKRERNVKVDTDLSAEALKELVRRYKALFKKETGRDFPQDPREQLWLAINAVFLSWNSKRAITYRKLNHIPDDLGTAVNVQTMVFGNFGNDSGTGVGFTRNPSTGKKEYYGEYLINAQGEDVVAGIRTPKHISELNKDLPHAYRELVKIYQKLEAHYKDMQDFEFTIERGKLYMLQTRAGKRTAYAAVRIAVEMVKEKLIDKKTAVLRIDPHQLDQLLHKQINVKAKLDVIAKGLPASPGAAVGKAVFTADEAERMADEEGEKVILVRNETSPEDIHGMNAAEGILTARGGMTSHAAVVARGMGKPCVAGCEKLHISEQRKELTVGPHTVKEGDILALNGSTGEVILGEVELIEPEMAAEFKTLMEWADGMRKLSVRTNADTPNDAKIARDFGAEGIGLCRTEHMFFEADRIKAVREMILADDEPGRRRALAKILPFQKKDFIGIFKAMKDLPVTIRLLDPPLHEFLPYDDQQISELALEMGVPEEKLKARVKSLHELNPMLGFRGCRLGVVYPEISEMQVKAIMEAACECTKEKMKVYPEIMIPLVGHVNEIKMMRELCVNTADGVIKETGVKVKYKVGTMIEVPRAAVTADEIAEYAEFFSFGTNDLTQMTYGFSRDDIGKFIPEYIAKKVMDVDPFQTLDTSGVGQLIEMAVKKGRSVRKDLKVGICGEHGGDPKSVEFCHFAGLTYVSCSPFRVPIARLAAAHANLKSQKVSQGVSKDK
ncbi:MAG: pyruvate, phosphate dikinase [Candidatus Altiarchaeota archaeon]|nr:pyruvate, phosphate dikinase [Candidatus Altiarchaeota archaeon]